MHVQSRECAHTRVAAMASGKVSGWSRAGVLSFFPARRKQLISFFHVFSTRMCRREKKKSTPWLPTSLTHDRRKDVNSAGDPRHGDDGTPLARDAKEEQCTATERPAYVFHFRDVVGENCPVYVG